MPVTFTEEIKDHLLYSLKEQFEMQEQCAELQEGDIMLYRKAQKWLQDQEAGRHPPSVKATVPEPIERFLRQLMDQLELLVGGETISMMQTRNWLDQEVKPYGPSSWVARAIDQPEDDIVSNWIIYWAREAVNQYQPPIKTSPTEYKVARALLLALDPEYKDATD